MFFLNLKGLMIYSDWHESMRGRGCIAQLQTFLIFRGRHTGYSSEYSGEIVQIQPVVLDEIMYNATMAGLDLIARFLYACPDHGRLQGEKRPPGAVRGETFRASGGRGVGRSLSPASAARWRCRRPPARSRARSGKLGESCRTPRRSRQTGRRCPTSPWSHPAW